MAKRIGADIGGTFTDVVGFDEETGTLLHLKVLTTPREPWKGLMDGIERLGWSLDTVSIIVHASTLGTNTFLGQVGLEIPVAVLVTNKGFRDVLEIGRQNRPELYNLFFEKPRPLIPRSRRIGVSGRIGPKGEELEPLNPDEVRKVAREWCGKAKVFVISFLHSYLNPVHEEQAKKIIQEECPGAIVVTSYEVDPQPKEYERTSTAVVNGVLKPLLATYIERVVEELRVKGFQGKLLVMQSSGGVAGSEEATRYPAAFIESGPAAGAVAVAYFSRLMGINRALGFDMGGTTAKASTIVDGEPLIVPEYEVGGKVHMGRLLRGSGYPVRYPYIDLAEVSAGGGTIAWIDPGGALRVGPVSAGADPGPACYGRGGEEPTITDANYVLGRLPDELAGGRVKLRRDLAEKALRKLGDRLGMGLEELASSIIRIANTVMARALRLVSVERGYDPREFSMFAFGGAGPLHAAALAAEIGVKEVVVPPLPGVFSALGLLVTDYRHDLHKAVVKKADEASEEELEKVFQDLEKEAVSMLLSEGVRREDIRITRLLDMHYLGQAYELTVPYRGDIGEAVEAFHEKHEARYGYSLRGEPVVIVNARIVAIGAIPKPQLPRGEEKPHRPEPRRSRRVFFEETGWVDTPVYWRPELRPGAEIEGPAIIESDESTILVPPSHVARVDGFFSVRITRG
ncbi:hydantoinase/oxoprolinase family protein [Pyrofollis japonicus]|uniref:hydantoinase/oxoprolinase family protein n=1 Tax=Pyrofollis japonicus TaxID=3060460 RepID=UPI00295B7DE0|nr:hydantoinase/oxoprolinase family protein [Pyrofollis japonicus]BEP17854.1 hydantoinase/oxoprolinase family protein [Pyrofollis japonicus]